MMLMKILLVSPEYPPHHIGGGGVVVQNLARTFVSKGHEVTVVAGHYRTKSVFEKVTATNDSGAKIFWLPLLPTPHVSFQLKTIMPPNLFSLAFLSRLLLGNKYDIINIHGFGHFLNDAVAFLSKLLSRKYIATIHGIPKQPERQSGMLEVIFRSYSLTLGKIFLKWASAITAVSKHTAQDTVAYGGNAKKVIVIPNGVDLVLTKSSVSRLNAMKRRYKLEKKRLVLGVGRLSENKGFHFLLSAMPRVIKEVPDAHLLIAGADGGYRNQLVRIINELSLSGYVNLAGEVQEDVKRGLYSIADVVVIPSIIEPFGLVALEAMAVGKPLVATRVDGLMEILRREKTRILVDPADSDQLAKAIVKILSDHGLRLRLSKASKETVSMYDWDKIANDYVKIFNEVPMHACFQNRHKTL